MKSSINIPASSQYNIGDKRRASVAPRTTHVPVSKKQQNMSMRERATSRDSTSREPTPRSNRSTSPIRDRQNVRDRRDLVRDGNSMEKQQQQKSGEQEQEARSTATASQFTVNILAEIEALRKQVAEHQERWHEFDDLRAELAALRSERDDLQQQLEDARATIEQLQKEKIQWSDDFPALTKSPQQQQQQHHIASSDDTDEMAVDPTGTAASQWAHAIEDEDDGITRAKQLQEKQQARRVQQYHKKRQQQQQQQKQQPASFAAIAQRNTKSRRRNVITAPSAAMMAWATRGFQEQSGETGYTFVYLRSPHRMPHSEVRKRLRVLGVSQARILDIHFPSKGTVGLLIHRSYEAELHECLKKHDITCKDYNPIDSSALDDPKHANLSQIDKEQLARDIHQRRIMRTCLFMPQKHVGMSILRYFSSKSYKGPHAVPEKMLNAFEKQNPTPKPTRPQRELTPEMAALAFGTTTQQYDGGNDTTIDDNNNMDLDSQQSNSNNSTSNTDVQE